MRIRGIYALLALAGIEPRRGRLCPKRALSFARERGYSVSWEWNLSINMIWIPLRGLEWVGGCSSQFVDSEVTNLKVFGRGLCLFWVIIDVFAMTLMKELHFCRLRWYRDCWLFWMLEDDFKIGGKVYCYEDYFYAFRGVFESCGISTNSSIPFSMLPSK